MIARTTKKIAMHFQEQWPPRFFSNLGGLGFRPLHLDWRLFRTGRNGVSAEVY